MTCIVSAKQGMRRIVRMAADKELEVKKVIDDWIDYYNNERYQWQLEKLSPNEYYEYIRTGIYPLSGIIKEPQSEKS